MGNRIFSWAKVLNGRSTMSITLAVTISDVPNFPRRTIFNSPSSILGFPCSSLRTYIAALDEASRPKRSVATGPPSDLQESDYPLSLRDDQVNRLVRWSNNLLSVIRHPSFLGLYSLL